MLQSLNKFSIFLAAPWILFCSQACAGTWIQFEDSALIGFESNEKTYGYYGAANSRTGFSCIFLFQTTEPSKGNASPQKILSFYTESNFRRRNIQTDINGKLYKNIDSWVITLDDQVGGCDAGVGWNFRLNLQDLEVKKFKSIKTAPAVGILLASKKTHFNKNINGKFISLKSFITKNDLFVVLKNSGNYSYGRYVNMDMAKVIDNPVVTTGWIQTADLINPFKND
jgi:hypothetical protein